MARTTDIKDFERRVLILVTSADADVCASVLREIGVEHRVCADLREIGAELAERGAAAVVLAEDFAETDGLIRLTEALRYQPVWSDVPILLLSRDGAESHGAGRSIALLGNVWVIERPLRAAMLVSALRRAIRARQRQYALRDQLDTLTRSEERFELASQAISDSLWDLDCARDSGDLARSEFGWSTPGFESAVGAWKGHVHADDRERVVASLRAALDGDATSWTAEYRFRAADGAYVHIVDRAQIIRDEKGRAVRAVGAMTNVTARKVAEQADALHAAIVSSSDDAIVSKTLDGTIRSWNAGAERLFGFTAAEAIGRHISLIIPEDKLAEEADILDRLRRGRRIDHFETVRVAKGGRKVDISLTVSPLADRDGKIFGASKVARDISARKRAESELRSQDARLRLLWETAAVLLTTDKPDTMLHGVFEKIAGYLGLDAYLNFMVEETGDGLRLESWEGVQPDDVDTLLRIAMGQNICGTVARDRKSIAAARIQLGDDPATATERRLGFRAYACFPLIIDGRLLGTLAFATRSKDELAADDLEFLETICRYVTAAYERVYLIGRLRNTDHRKDEFLATLAHELRNPLAPIRNALEIMRVNGGDRSAVEQASRQMIERQLEQMVRLVDDLLDVSRITRGKLELRKTRVELAAVVKSAVETSRPLIDTARHALTIELPRQPVFLHADPVRLAQVFANLLNNAARYMDQGGRILLKAERIGTQLVVRVKDEGVGIPADALPRIFDMFAQVDETQARSRAGLGIGLTLVKRLVELHGGDVEAHSEGAGRGAELIVRLPVAGAAAAPRAHAPAPAPAECKTPHRILVADDNRDAAESLGMLLRLMGNDVRTVYNGDEAVEEAEAFRPDVILLDIGMPKLNGYDAARRIRSRQWAEDTMLVAVTGWGQDEDKRKAQDAGFDRHFTKPLDPAALQRLIADFRAD
jgi:PAS domain S-box-containing protein